MLQEMSLTVWRILRRRPDAPREYLAAAVRKTALKYLGRGKSVNRLSQHKRPHPWQTESLEALLEDDDVEKPRSPTERGDGNSPVEDAVITKLLYAQLQECLNSRQDAYLHLRLLGFRPVQAQGILHLTRGQRVQTAVGIRLKAQKLWDINERPATVAEAAQELCLSPVLLGKLCREGKIQGAYCQGHQWYIPRPVRVKEPTGLKV